MTAELPPAHRGPRKPEPPLIERARRAGWMMLVLSVGAMVLARFGPEAARVAAISAAAVLGLFGLLCIVNVALVRGIYRELDKAREAAETGSRDQSK